uniref:Uncharacterized protein n=1 Tax=Callorhinchus milii TaxID=7868 RepID=A0A4W3HQW3_CALMI
MSLLLVPRTLCSTIGGRAFSHCAPELWNTLPQSLCLAPSLPFQVLPENLSFRPSCYLHSDQGWCCPCIGPRGAPKTRTKPRTSGRGEGILLRHPSPARSQEPPLVENLIRRLKMTNLLLFLFFGGIIIRRVE